MEILISPIVGIAIAVIGVAVMVTTGLWFVVDALYGIRRELLEFRCDITSRHLDSLVDAKIKQEIGK